MYRPHFFTLNPLTMITPKPADATKQLTDTAKQTRLKQEMSKIGQLISEAASLGQYECRAPDDLSTDAAIELLSLGYRIENRTGIKNIVTGKLFVPYITWKQTQHM